MGAETEWRDTRKDEMAETIRCPFCNRENDSTATRCTKCDAYVRSELGYLREIDTSLKTIKSISICWLILVILAIIVSAVYGLNRL
jgi:hypothetical protein